ncbi:MAG: BREX-6 system adenine-specific DNA-methyltransferase PglX, partial [Phormidesmis sp.]
MTHLTPDAKAKLARTIRDFRGTASDPNGGLLLKGMREAAEGTYRLSIASAEKAGLAEEQLEKRKRLEKWLNEQVRADVATQKPKDKQQEKFEQESRARHLADAIKLAGATVLNRLVVIKQLEAHGMVKPAVVTGGWNSAGYREFREFAPDLCKGETEGYGLLLKLLCDELALELPGLFGAVGLTELFAVPASTLRTVVDGLNAPELVSAWTDDTTLGWVYQYWNDPEREALDAKLNGGGKVEPHEVASKTQMFTERYMVEWLLQNSLGQQWLAICARNGWEPEAIADGTLARLEERRKDWREKRERGEVALDALMPIETEAEERWKYWVQQPALTGEGIPSSIKDLKIFDPACGSGHFLAIAFDFLFAFYAEEARHRGESWTEREMVESILENNLYGLDLDARAVQIAAAGLYLKGKAVCAAAGCEAARPKGLNLVASDLNLAMLPVADEARQALRAAVQETTGIPGALTDEIVAALAGADAWGSLLRVDGVVDEAISAYEKPIQSNLLENNLSNSLRPRGEGLGMRAILLEQLETFLASRTRSDDLGLRLKGEQLAAGVRFIRMVRENAYDLVVGNPPYQGASKLVDSAYLKQRYPKAKADLYAAFLERGLQLVKPGGLSAMVTMRNWMFISQYSAIREYLIETYDLRALGDFDRGAFDEVPNEVLAITLSIFQKTEPSSETSVATQPTPFDDTSYDRQRTNRKRAAVLAQVGRFEFETTRFDVIKEKPLIYWWDKAFLKKYAEASKVEDAAPVCAGMQTSNNIRYLRLPWEVSSKSVNLRTAYNSFNEIENFTWVPYIKGAAGKKWFEPLDTVLLWKSGALEKQVMYDHFGSNGGGNGTPSRQFYFSIGVAFSMIGASFAVRAHRFRSVIGDKGASVFPQDVSNVTCLLNSQFAQNIASALNPSVSFQTGDVNRLPLFPIESADEIFTQLEAAFTTHESAREPSVEFIHPGPTCWPYAQTWAQQSVDRPAGEPLPPWEPEYEEPKATDWISYAIGLALGRFPLTPAPTSTPLSHRPTDTRGLSVAEALPHGILYLSAYSADQPTSPDSLTHPACAPLHTAWATHSSAIATKSFHEWLRLNFFTGVHLPMYEQRPIYFPLSSAHKNFVAHISIHRWTPHTLTDLLAEYTAKDLTTLEGELTDLADSKNQGNPSTQAKAETRYAHLQALHTELTAFIALIRQCADLTPPPANPKDPQPELPKVSYQMDLDDGVMINSAALWPLLEPQWK